MSDYLTKDWPLAETSTVRMSGKSNFQLRRYGKPGIIATVEMFAADAQSFRDAVNERVRDAQAEALEMAEIEIRDARTLDKATRAAICAVLRGRARRLRAGVAGATA